MRARFFSLSSASEWGCLRSATLTSLGVKSEENVQPEPVSVGPCHGALAWERANSVSRTSRCYGARPRPARRTTARSGRPPPSPRARCGGERGERCGSSRRSAPGPSQSRPPRRGNTSVRPGAVPSAHCRCRQSTILCPRARRVSSRPARCGAPAAPATRARRGTRIVVGLDRDGRGHGQLAKTYRACGAPPRAGHALCREILPRLRRAPTDWRILSAPMKPIGWSLSRRFVAALADEWPLYLIAAVLVLLGGIALTFAG
jgi:hypothetical protein